MDIGLNLWIWGAPMTDAHVAEWIPRAARMGFNAVEFPVESRHGFDYERAGELLGKHDLEASVVVAMTDERDFLHDDAEVRDNAGQYVRHCVDAAASLGADRVAGPLYSAVHRTWWMSDADRELANDRIVSQLSELAEYADDRDVTLCVEPLNRFETSVLNTAEQAVEVADRVDHPGCEILLDTFHMNIEERSIPDAIRRTGDRLGHFHACGNDRGPPGSGTIDWDGVAAALADIGYDDLAVIESYNPSVESLARAAAIWRPLADSQDAFAEDGLATLRGQFV